MISDFAKLLLHNFNERWPWVCDFSIWSFGYKICVYNAVGRVVGYICVHNMGVTAHIGSFVDGYGFNSLEFGFDDVDVDKIVEFFMTSSNLVNDFVCKLVDDLGKLGFGTEFDGNDSLRLTVYLYRKNWLYRLFKYKRLFGAVTLYVRGLQDESVSASHFLPSACLVVLDLYKPCNFVIIDLIDFEVDRVIRFFK